VGNYGTTITNLTGERLELKDLSEEHAGKTFRFYAFLQNVRKQGAKMAFTELRSTGEPWSAQALVVEGENVSRQMVKWTNGLTTESYVAVEV
jgi:aspartyl/asparaginyl-tRNA synthetase